MKIKSNKPTVLYRAAFTLIEMIGVLAVIAILAAVLVPKVFQAINDSRINNSAMSCQTVKTAIIDHYAKFGSLNAGVTTPPVTITSPTNNYDGYLLQEAFLDKPFAVKIGDGLATTQIELDTADALAQPPTAAAAVGTTTHTAGQAAFNLDGVGAVNDATGSLVVYAVITGVTLNDARELNHRVDGTSTTLGEAGPLGSATAGAETDLSGRVKYKFATGVVTTTVYVYLTHR